MISEHFTNTKLLSIHKIWLDTLLKGSKLRLVRSPLRIKFWSTAENTSAFKGYRNGDYVSMCWQSITVIFSDIMSFQNYIVKDLCFYSIQHKKRKQSILLLCCKGFPRIGKLAHGCLCLKSTYNALQTLEHWVRHVCLPIVSLEVHESFRDITLATYTKVAAKNVLKCFSLQILCIEFFSE